MKKILTLITVLFITAPAYAQEYSKKELKSINKGIEAITKTYDEFDDETDWDSPSLKDVAFYRTKYKDGKVRNYLRIRTVGSTLNVGEKGLTVIFEDGTRFERPDAEIKADAGSGSGWNYRVFEAVNDEELSLFATKKIKVYKLYIYEGALYGKDPLLTMGYAQGILEAK